MRNSLKHWATPLALSIWALIAVPGSEPRTVVEPAEAAAATPFHPHFPKTLECRVSRDLTVTVRYQTVTFDKAGAKKMKPGQAWHLAGAAFETSKDLVVGGQAVAAGKYALSARKAKGGKWQLTLHEGRGFSRPGQDAIELETEFDGKSTLYEHMNIDVQPAGDKDNTALHLEVRFDEMLARALIEVPKADKKQSDR